MDPRVKLKNENPKTTANILSKLFFGWMLPLYRKGAKDGIEASDLYKILKSDDSHDLGDKLESNWNAELERARSKNTAPSLTRAIFSTFFWGYMAYGVLVFIQHVGLRSFQPLVLSYLISLFANPEEDNSSCMYKAASVLVGLSILVILSMHHGNYGQAFVGMRIRIALSSLIYRKTLKLNKKSLSQTDVGKVVNLLSNDVTRFDLVILTLHYLWIMPIQALLIIYLIWRQVGLSSFAGVIAISLLSLPLQGYLGKLTSNLRLKVAQRTDRRVTLMSEIISGMQVIKMYAWEKPFERIVRLARLDELKMLSRTSYIRGFYLSSMLFVERIALFVTLTCHVMLGYGILAEQVFAISQFFSLMQLTMAIFYPMCISYGAETLVAIKRIQHYLMMEETGESVVERDFDKGVLLRNVRASWKSDNVTLRDITLNVPPGSLCIVIGSVGSGKSSLLQLLLGEITPETGTVKVQGNISYASQEPWLFASTIRNNILFGLPYDKNLYSKVVRVCSLQKDLDQLPLGDRTLVGERGAALSGGQRARVNLARAIYRQADVYLLDDPLSAVDIHVSKHLFRECILGHLKGKTRVLVTHQLQYLKKADIIVLINEGKIEDQGTYYELSKRDSEFTKTIITPSSEEKTSGKELTAEFVAESKSPLLLSGNFVLESFETKSYSDRYEEESTPTDGSSLKDYIKASGNRCLLGVLVILLIATQLVCSSADYWVTFWTRQEYAKSFNSTKDETVEVPVTQTVEYYPDGDSNVTSSYYYTYVGFMNITKEVTVKEDYQFIETHLIIYVYTGLIATAIVIALARSFLYFKIAMNASRNLHNRMFSALLKAPMRFFNTNPMGRILNRFSKDMGAIDEILPRVLLESIQITLVLFGILVMVTISNYYLIIAILFLGFIFMKIRFWFIKTSKNVKHLEGITKSPIFSYLNSSLNGVTTIRAFDAGEMLKQEFDDLQNVHTSSWFLLTTCMVSFGLWLDIICVIFIACTTFSFIILNQYGQVSGSFVGLAISQALYLTGMLQYGVRQTAEVINQLTSVERVLQYTNIDEEELFTTPRENRPKEPWPSEGLLEVQNLYLQYSENEMPVLKGLNFTIKPGQKIGIVGRTGAGKSSLIAALFRLSNIDGRILIDKVDTRQLGLHDLRRRLSIIPQEPVLFSASLRYNLDPFCEFDDATLWQVLEEVELREAFTSLDVVVASGGINFSLGQKQLLCLARAILRNNKILVLDEATANIDPKTDSLIQETIRRKFKNCTVLVIAHRLNTIMDSDRVIVMDAGRIIESGHPYELLQKPGATFYKMVLDTGFTMSSYLEDIALDAYLS